MKLTTEKFIEAEPKVCISVKQTGDWISIKATTSNGDSNSLISILPSGEIVRHRLGGIFKDLFKVTEDYEIAENLK